MQGVTCLGEVLDKFLDVPVKPIRHVERSIDAPASHGHAQAFVEVAEHDRFRSEARLLQPMANKYKALPKIVNVALRELP